jgi:hypothetical protein
MRVTTNKTHEQFVLDLARIHPDLTVLSKYTRSIDAVLFKDKLGIVYKTTPDNLFDVKEVSIRCALDKTAAFKAKLKLIQPDITVLGDYIDGKTLILISDKYNIKYNVTPAGLLENSPPRIVSALNKNEAFQTKLNIIQPTLILISNYINNLVKVIVRDALNIEYSMQPSRLLSGDVPSILSACDKNLYFKLKCANVHSNKYDYSISNYKSHDQKIDIICKKHNVFSQRAVDHISGNGCIKCRNESNNGPMESLFKHFPETPVFIYFFKCSNDEEEFYKVGLSNNPNKRVYGLPYKIEIISYYKSTVGELYPVEKAYHERFKQLNIQYIPKKNFGGWTECFKITNNEK